MIQVILLDQEEVNAMRRGEHITLHVQGTTVNLGFTKIRKEGTRKPRYACKCTRLFKSKLALSMHLHKQKGKAGHGPVQVPESEDLS